MRVTARRRVPRSGAPRTALGAQGAPRAIEPRPVNTSLRGFACFRARSDIEIARPTPRQCQSALRLIFAMRRSRSARSVACAR
jgi:hypothetical protein